MKPRISAIAAIGENRELGKSNQLIWHLPDDLQRLKKITNGHPLIMGRKTHESIGRPLPGRTNIVISQTVSEINGCVVCSSAEAALAHAVALDGEEVFIFGGGQIYRALWDQITRLYLTVVHASDTAADTFFPNYSDFTTAVEVTHGKSDDLSYTYLTLDR